MPWRRPSPPWLKRVTRAVAAAALGAAALTIAADFVVGMHGEERIRRTVDAVETHDAALILGTSKYVAPGRLNEYYLARIRAAHDLYRLGKVRGFVVSGDNSTLSYNEPQRMKEDLTALGVPAEFITCDYAGRRTLGSVVRMKEVFGISRYVIVTQEFHLPRALYIADAREHDAVGLAAPGVLSDPRLRLREMLARALALLDVSLFSREPRFLGERVAVPLRPPSSP